MDYLVILVVLVMDDKIDYVKLSIDAIKATLHLISKGSFDHSLVMSFFTSHVGVSIPSYIKSSFPHSITIILQYQFRELLICEDSFSVILTFKGKEERIVVPFNAIHCFILNIPETQKDSSNSKNLSIVSRQDNIVFINSKI